MVSIDSDCIFHPDAIRELTACFAEPKMGGILAYAWIMGFYAVNTSWAAPVILSASDEKSLDFREKLVTSQQTIEDLKVDSNKLETGLTEMKEHRAALLALDPQLRDAIDREKAHNPRQVRRAPNSTRKSLPTTPKPRTCCGK